MPGEARFTYTDADMGAVLRAGWRWTARGRNLVIAYAAMIACNSLYLAALNLAFGTRPVPEDPYAVFIGSAAELALFYGLLFVMAKVQGANVLHKVQRASWDGDALDGEHVWAWDADGLHVQHARGRADLPWRTFAAWLDAPQALLLFPTGGRTFSVPEAELAAGWRTAPKVFLMPAGGFALALPKRVLAPGDADGLIAALRAAGAKERRGLGMGAGAG